MLSEPQTDRASEQHPESAVCRRYAAQLEAIAQLDRAYYVNPSPTLLDRTEYYQRQEVLQEVRHRLYAAPEVVRKTVAK